MRKTMPALLAVGVALALTGCSAEDVAKNATEELLEKAIESGAEEGSSGEGSDGSSPNVEVDLGDGEDGEMSITTEGGEMSFGTQEYPKLWPEEIPQIDLAIEMSTGVGGAGADVTIISVSGTTDASPEDVLATYQQAMTDWDVRNESTMESDGQRTEQLSYQQGPEEDPDRVFLIAASVQDGDPTMVKLDYQDYQPGS